MKRWNLYSHTEQNWTRVWPIGQSNNMEENEVNRQRNTKPEEKTTRKLNVETTEPTEHEADVPTI